jgi:TonB family protein
MSQAQTYSIEISVVDRADTTRGLLHKNKALTIVSTKARSAVYRSAQRIGCVLSMSVFLHAIFFAFALNYGDNIGDKIVHQADNVEFAVVEQIETTERVAVEKTLPPLLREIDPLLLPPNHEYTTEIPPTDIIAGIAETSTAESNGVNVAVGNTLYDAPPTVAPDTEAIKPYQAKQYSPMHLVSEMPIYLRNIDVSEIRKFYPEEARKAEIEKSVGLKLLVDADGTVAQATVVRDPGYGFANAAQQLALRMRFKPARVNGNAVATEIPFTLRFLLN